MFEEKQGRSMFSAPSHALCSAFRGSERISFFELETSFDSRFIFYFLSSYLSFLLL